MRQHGDCRKGVERDYFCCFCKGELFEKSLDISIIHQIDKKVKDISVQKPPFLLHHPKRGEAMRNPNGYGSITKLSGNRRRPYWVRFAAASTTADGVHLKENRKTIGYYATKKEAIAALAEYNRSPYDLSKQTTFGELFNKWLTEKTIGDKAKYSYTEAFNKCAPIASRPIAELRLNHFQAIIDSYSHTSKSNVNNIITVIKGICSYAMRYDLISKDYSAYIKAKYTIKEDIHKAFTNEDIQAFWDMPSSEFRDITLILLYSGWRISELLNLNEINTAENYMKGGMKTKAGKDRIVPTHPRIQPILQAYTDGFTMKYNDYKDKIKLYGHLPHDTRHTFISRLQNAGADHVSIERLVGHSSKGVTDKVYTHKTIEDLRKVVELLS